MKDIMKHNNCVKPKHTDSKLRYADKNTQVLLSQSWCVTCTKYTTLQHHPLHCSTPLPRLVETLLRVYLQVIVKSHPNSPLTYLSDGSGDWACFLMQFILVLCPSPSLSLLDPYC